MQGLQVLGNFYISTLFKHTNLSLVHGPFKNLSIWMYHIRIAQTLSPKISRTKFYVQCAMKFVHEHKKFTIWLFYLVS